MAKHCHWWSGSLVLVGGKHTPAIGSYAKGGEITSRDVFSAQRAGSRFNALTPDTQKVKAGLERGGLFKLRGLRLQPLIEGKRKHPPPVLRAALYTAIIALTDTIERPRIRNRQGAQHYGVNQGEDGCSPADPQGQREHGGAGKNRRH